MSLCLALYFTASKGISKYPKICLEFVGLSVLFPGQRGTFSRCCRTCASLQFSVTSVLVNEPQCYAIAFVKTFAGERFNLSPVQLCRSAAQ